MKETLLEMKSKSIMSPFLYSTLAELLQEELAKVQEARPDLLEVILQVFLYCHIKNLYYKVCSIFHSSMMICPPNVMSSARSTGNIKLSRPSPNSKYNYL